MEKEIKLHLGSGKRYLEGYLHIDIADFEHIDIKTSINNLSMIEKNSVDEIYASHVLEYFDREEVLVVLEEWKRVLKKGGTLRLAVPNFTNLIKVYEQSGELERILGPLYGKWSVDNIDSIYHKTVYDQKSLSLILSKVGFTDIRLWDWRKIFSQYSQYDDHSQAYYPHMDKDNGIHISLNLECKK